MVNGDAETVDLYRQAADAGDTDSAYHLANCFYHGVGVLQDGIEALRWYRVAADRGSAKALEALGHYYESCWHDLEDDAEAVKWYRRAAEAGNANGAYNLAHAFHYGLGVPENEAEALRWYCVAAEKDHDDALVMLGHYFETGLGGLAPNKAEAISLYRRAAEAGNAHGAYRLASCFDSGVGVPLDETEALRWYRIAAEQDHADALCMLGYYYSNGSGGLLQDNEEAVGWYRRAAEAGDADGAFQLADSLNDGLGVSKNETEALRWYRVAAERDHASAFDMLGCYYKDGLGELVPNDAEAVAWFRRAAEAGDANGTYNFAVCLDSGIGVLDDQTEALRWYRIAAEQDHDGALNTLGLYYEKGLGGLAPDNTEAIVRYRRSAELGNPIGTYNLARSFDCGIGVPEDATEALRWYRVAAEQDYAQAFNTLGIYYENGLGELAPSDAEAVAWFRRAAEVGNADGAYNLARFFYYGTGVPEDETEALRWYRVAAEQGHADALNKLGEYYENGLGGLASDCAKAVIWYRRAADEGNVIGAYNLARSFYSGDCILEDETEALRWYRVAAEQDHASALDMLGYFYQNGLAGLEEDSVAAAHWYRKAVEAGDPDALTDLGYLLIVGGPGLEPNTAEAAYWLRRASEHGDAHATYLLAHLHENGLPGVASSKAEAIRLYAIAAENGNTDAGKRLQVLTSAPLPSERPAPVIIAYDHRFLELDKLRGLEPVKQRLKAFAQTVDMARRRKALGRRSPSPNAHMLFLGNPGTGKTTVARIVGNMLASVGLLPSGHVVEVNRADLVGQFIGATEKKTAEYIEKAMGGVLFIDEAYALVPPDSPRDFGPQALDTILTAMENHRDKFIVIFAGYEREMKRLLDYNPGLASRVPTRVVFPDYSPEELLEIALDQIQNDHDFSYEDGVEDKLRDLIEGRFVPPKSDFANARSVRNLVDEIVSHHAGRLDADLELLQVCDIPDPPPHTIKSNPMEDLNEMIGLASVKREVTRWSAQLNMARLRQRQGKPLQSRPDHMIFMGSPGTGKTVVAEIVGRVLVENGMLTRDRVHAVTRVDLVGQYQGQTAPRVEKAFEAAEGGVLFVDEAYALSQGSHDELGREAINTMVHLIENMRDRVLVILAGYTEDMADFLRVNVGLSSRFPTRIHFEDYTAMEMLLIFEKMCFDRRLYLSHSARQKAETVLATHAGSREFGNGRGVRNLVNKTLANMDVRLDQAGGVGDLFKVESEDFPD